MAELGLQASQETPTIGFEGSKAHRLWGNLQRVGSHEEMARFKLNAFVGIVSRKICFCCSLELHSQTPLGCYLIGAQFGDPQVSCMRRGIQREAEEFAVISADELAYFSRGEPF